MSSKNEAAVKLGKMAKGKPKRITRAERNRRKQRLETARKLRWNLTNETH